jgi:hypothetical protein
VQKSEAVHEIVAKKFFLLQRSKREKTSHEPCYLCMYPTYSKRDIDRQTIDREDRQTMERETERETEREYRQVTDTETNRKKHRKEERASSLRERNVRSATTSGTSFVVHSFVCM